MTAIYKIQTKHLNEHSTLYGGQLLEWIDNYCFAKSEKYKYCAEETLVTRNLQCDFLHPAYLGDIVTLSIKEEKIGRTSVAFSFVAKTSDLRVAEGKATFVKLKDGKKSNIR
jgi:acyl-CoA hydrolase